MTRTVDHLGVVIPARRDGANAASTTRAVLDAADSARVVPVTVVVVDDGENGALRDGLPNDPNVVLVATTEHGPGHARTAGAVAFGERIASVGSPPDRSWVISLDADVLVDGEFIGNWFAEIERTDADVLCAPAHFGALPGELALSRDAEAASGWMWADTAFYERFVGVVNSGGCNHAVSLATCGANGRYLQPTAEFDGRRVIVAGDDWDFGLRARMSGFSVERVPAPVIVTSTRRIVSDPVGFLAGRSYEREFVPVRDGAGTDPWPPIETWGAIAARGRARLVAHFLLKPILAGIEPDGAFEWFLGEALTKELARIRERAPRRGAEWNAYRTELIDLLFEPEVFAFCGRVAAHLAGASAA